MILFELVDFDLLRVIWWVLLGVLLIGFAVTDGFDMGVGALLPFVAKTDIERRVAINTVGPVWEGNQVWFILGGGAIFAAWPPLYAASSSRSWISSAGSASPPKSSRRPGSRAGTTRWVRADSCAIRLFR